MNVIVDTLERYLTGKASTLTEYWVAYSGGLDSHVLLHALCQLQNKHSFRLNAIHINHQLQSESSDWVQHCRRQCKLLGVDCEVLNVDASAGQRQSPEDAARIARYRAIQDTMPEDAVLLTGHHQTDQAETLLLQLMRGSGLAGLAAMPETKSIDGLQHERPLLNCPHHEFLHYAEAQQLHWIEDPSNQDLSIRRNFIRHEILPSLETQWSGANALISKSADYLADALQLQESLLDDLLSKILLTPDCMPLDQLMTLPQVQQRHCLRHWYLSLGLPRPPESLLKQIFNDVIQTREDAQPRIQFAGSQLLKSKHKLLLLPDWQPPEAETIDVKSNTKVDRDAFSLDLVIDTELEGANIRCQLGDYSASIDLRGQERALKKFYKEIGLAMVLRSVMPLIFVDDKLMLIPGLYQHDSLTGITYSFNLKGLVKAEGSSILEIFR